MISVDITIHGGADEGWRWLGLLQCIHSFVSIKSLQLAGREGRVFVPPGSFENYHCILRERLHEGEELAPPGLYTQLANKDAWFTLPRDMPLLEMGNAGVIGEVGEVGDPATGPADMIRCHCWGLTCLTSLEDSGPEGVMWRLRRRYPHGYVPVATFILREELHKGGNIYFSVGLNAHEFSTYGAADNLQKSQEAQDDVRAAQENLRRFGHMITRIKKRVQMSALEWEIYSELPKGYAKDVKDLMQKA